MSNEYSDTGSLRTEFPRLDSPFGAVAYWKSLNFLDHGHIMLGGFEPPYDGQPGADRTLTVNRVPYSGSITVYLSRQGVISLDFSGMHPRGEWRETPSDAARRKMESHFLPLALQLFPVPTPENIAGMIRADVARNVKSAVSSYVHTLSSNVWHDSRYTGHAEDIRAGLEDGLQRAAEDIKSENFSVNTRY